MKKILLSATALVVAGAFALTGCSSERGGDTGSGSGDEAKGFAADATIGVALPDKTSENWVLAGQLFTDGLKKAGFKADVQYAPASNTVAEQQNQIQAMVTGGAKVIIIGAKDGKQLSTQVEAARDAGVTVIAYDRLIENTEAVDYYVAFDNFKVGQLQGQALLDGLAERAGHEAPYNIELFSGSPDDANAPVFFNGAMEVLQPKIDDGTLKVVSGQTEIAQTATEGWKPENAQRRMDSLLTSSYGSETLDGVLSPNDTLARAIITSVQGAGKPVPVVTGQDSEVESVKSIMEGIQYSTINKDTTLLVEQSIKMVGQLQKGEEVDVNDTEQYDNGKKIVPSYLLDPIIVTKENAAEAYANVPSLLEIVKSYQ
ncbi:MULTISPECIES: sugar-binding protein [unclassified Microbacterium]|uniref:substrate-binding domain-containing protein n=1 Tax=unclassified Microbacterium TaxID=2609290 RepID=UPI000CFD6533|nr:MULTISPECIES: sugar-binding protein [unclassified Microbacterium]PQZ57486.1 sugar ABC transporter substrate-binding protein [Microbacterium sp. MYb43]PQZ77304.1 sugar ABC transporter substrate-binding protein [Microbacterium sp. MYb40]PRB22717.1 sugar ABC transporter substrate-binding protein [Microbacterium sp. MYb54]PRB28941.1 sugar ABC transporter substrate-binding protein [Microbacterium sp. MYb50]PRB68983.1 sugar ABC transporter substrate-binding protein [Microbacterium sp. MYb24]